jgi:hypothetical protein
MDIGLLRAVVYFENFARLVFVSMVAVTLPWIQGGNMAPKDWHEITFIYYFRLN